MHKYMADRVFYATVLFNKMNKKATILSKNRPAYD